MIMETSILRLVLILKMMLLLMGGGLLAIAPLVRWTAVSGIIWAAEKPRVKRKAVFKRAEERGELRSIRHCGEA